MSSTEHCDHNNLDNDEMLVDIDIRFVDIDVRLIMMK